MNDISIFLLAQAKNLEFIFYSPQLSYTFHPICPEPCWVYFQTLSKIWPHLTSFHYGDLNRCHFSHRWDDNLLTGLSSFTLAPTFWLLYSLYSTYYEAFYNLTQIGSLFCSKSCNMSPFNLVKANILKITYKALHYLLPLPTCSPLWSNFLPIHPSLLYSSNILAFSINDFLCLEETSSSDLHDKVPHLSAVFAVIYLYVIVIFITSDFLPQHVWFPFPYFTLFSYT